MGAQRNCLRQTWVQSPATCYGPTSATRSDPWVLNPRVNPGYPWFDLKIKISKKKKKVINGMLVFLENSFHFHIIHQLKTVPFSTKINNSPLPKTWTSFFVHFLLPLNRCVIKKCSLKTMKNMKGWNPNWIKWRKQSQVIGEFFFPKVFHGIQSKIPRKN